MPDKYRCLFGPVPSRRFGRSLGIDLTPFKTCSFDCVFCQLGHTTCHTDRRENYVSTEMVKAELDRWLKTDGQANQITLAGSGEPTLHAGFGEIVRYVKSQTSIPVAVLTNGSMLHLPEVREGAKYADIVKISLSAWDQESFSQINRPCAGVTFEKLIEGERKFRLEFNGRLWMEVFLLWGINSAPENVKHIAEIAKQIKPDCIQLNTCVRPPAENFARAVPEAQMNDLARIFSPAAEVIAEFRGVSVDFKASEDAIYDMLRRRPCTSIQIAKVFGMHLNEVSKYIGKLMRENRIQATNRDSDVYYFAETDSRAIAEDSNR